MSKLLKTPGVARQEHQASKAKSRSASARAVQAKVVTAKKVAAGKVCSGKPVRKKAAGGSAGRKLEVAYVTTEGIRILKSPLKSSRFTDEQLDAAMDAAFAHLD